MTTFGGIAPHNVEIGGQALPTLVARLRVTNPQRRATPWQILPQQHAFRIFDGREVALPSWTAAQADDWLCRWALNLMLINVSTRKLRRAVRLPEGDLPIMARDGTSKSAASRRVRGAVAERLAKWMASDLSKLAAAFRRAVRSESTPKRRTLFADKALNINAIHNLKAIKLLLAPM